MGRFNGGGGLDTAGRADAEFLDGKGESWYGSTHGGAGLKIVEKGLWQG